MSSLFVYRGLPSRSVRKIFGIYCESINPPGDLDLWPLHLKTVTPLVNPKVIPYTKFEHFGIILFRVMLQINRQTNRLTRKSYQRRPTESAWVITAELLSTATFRRILTTKVWHFLQWMWTVCLVSATMRLCFARDSRVFWMISEWLVDL